MNNEKFKKIVFGTEKPSRQWNPYEYHIFQEGLMFIHLLFMALVSLIFIEFFIEQTAQFFNTESKLAVSKYSEC